MVTVLKRPRVYKNLGKIWVEITVNTDLVQSALLSIRWVSTTYDKHTSQSFTL